MQSSVKDDVLNYIISQSERYHAKSFDLCHAQSVAEKLHISRSLASHYLNELSEAKVLIKILSRPVCFIHRETIEELYDVSITQSDFLSKEEFAQYLATSTGGSSSFARMVGAEGSLKAVITQSIAALSYPGGLPFILYGEHGTGKSELVNLLFDYGMTKNILSDQSILHHLYIEKGDKEVEEKCEKLLNETNRTGVICFHHAQHLSIRLREKVAQYLHRQRYKGQHFHYLMILCMEQNPSDVFSIELMQQFPMVLMLPSLEKRPLEEKEELLVKYLKEEEKRFHKPILISTAAFHVLCQYHYPHNQISMKKAVMLVCANGNFQHQDHVEITMKELSEQMDLETESGDMQESKMIRLDQFRADHEETRLIQVLDAILQMFEQNSVDLSDAMRQAYLMLKEYYDVMVFRHLYSNRSIRFLESLIAKVMESMDQQFHVKMPMQCIYILARVMYLFSKSSTILGTWEKQNHDRLAHCVEQMNDAYPNEELVCSRIHQLLSSGYDRKMNEIDILLFMIYLHYYNRSFTMRDSVGIIVSHGYATASSICDAVNTLLGEYVFDAIDMPLDIGNEAILSQLETYVRKFAIKKRMIVLVDMGSLEGIGERLSALTGGEVGIVNNVSTALALEIGSLMLKNYDMQDVLKQALNGLHNHYFYYSGKERKEAIVFTSESSEYAAAQMLKLFSDSLPVPLEIELLTNDFHDLQKYGAECPIFKQYRVLLIAGTMDPKVDRVPYVAIEDIISGNSGVISSCLSAYLSETQIRELNHEMLVHFSLNNVMENITILNPNKLLELVVASIDEMETYFQLQLNGRDKIGLYLHVSCLIERLVTKRCEKENADLTMFVKEKHDFITGVKTCFQETLEHYQVELPVNEILYLYEYIVKDEKEVKRYRGE